MAQINFPDATADGQIFEADTGVIYTYIGTPPNGYWSGTFGTTGTDTLDQRYVKLDDEGIQQTIRRAGLKFNNATTGDTIVLNPDGSATFAGDVSVGTRYTSGATVAKFSGDQGAGKIEITNPNGSGNDNQLLSIYDPVTNEESFYVLGDGSAKFAGRVQCEIAEGNNDYCFNGIVRADNARPVYSARHFALDGSTAPVLQGLNRVGTVTSNIYADGSATFAGTVTAESFVVTGGNGGGPGDAGDLHVTGDLQVDGSAEFAGNVILAGAYTDKVFSKTTTNSSKLELGARNAIGTESTVLTLNVGGSAEFAGDVSTLNSSNQSAHYLFNTGSHYIYNIADDAAALKIYKGSDRAKETIELNSSGSATFAGTVTVSDIDISSNTVTGCEVRSDGLVRSQRISGSSSAVFQGWRGSYNSSSIFADGSAEFAETVVIAPDNGRQVELANSPAGGVIYLREDDGTRNLELNGADGSVSANGTISTGDVSETTLAGNGARMRQYGDITIRRDGSRTSVFSIWQDGAATANQKISLYNDGTAEITGAITGKSTIQTENTYYNPAFRAKDRTTNKYTSWISGNGGLFLGTDLDADDGGSTVPLKGSSIFLNGTDGSAEFAGPVIIDNISSNSGWSLDAVNNDGREGRPTIRVQNLASGAPEVFGVLDQSDNTTVTFKSDGSAEFAGGITAGGDCVIEPGSLNAYQSSNSNTATVFNGGWNTGGGRNITSTIYSDGSATFAGLVSSGNWGVDIKATRIDNGIVTTVNSDDTQYAFRSYYNGYNTSDVTAEIKVDGSATFNGTVTIKSGLMSRGYVQSQESGQGGAILCSGGYAFRGYASSGGNDFGTPTYGITYGGDASFRGIVFDLEPDNDANYTTTTDS